MNLAQPNLSEVGSFRKSGSNELPIEQTLAPMILY